MFGGRNLMSSFNSNSGGGILSTIKSKISMNAISIIIFVVIIIALSIYYYYQYVAPKLNATYVANKQPNYNTENNTNQTEFLFFYVDWCPHCKTAKPEWEKVKEEYQGKTINGYTVIFKEINCTNESTDIEQMISQYKIEGYPTLKLLKDGQVIDFDSQPTKSSLEQFLNSVL